MFKSLLQKLLGGYLERKAALYDGTPTEGKVWYKSKTVLSGIAVLLRGIYEGVSGILVSAGHSPLPSVPPLVDGLLGVILGGTAIQGRIDANQPIVIDETKSPKDQAPPSSPAK